MPSEQLRDVLSRTDVSRSDKLLIILASSGQPLPVSEVRKVATEAGLRAAQRWNVSQLLGTAKGLVVRVEEGWALTTRGQKHIDANGYLPRGKASKVVVVDLRKHLDTIGNSDTRNFLSEAISCFEHELYRSAVVLSWVGAVSLLYDYVIRNELGNFNAEAKRRDSKWRSAKTSDDLARMKEHDFMDILEALSIVGKNVKQELQNNCLKFRNACGHPGSLSISQNRVAAHLEILVLNVFSRFA